MIQFLDIVVSRQMLDAIQTRRISDSLQALPKPAVPDTTTPQDTSHVISNVDFSGNMQQLADVAPAPLDLGEALGTNMMLALFIVLLALCLCCYFVIKYRKSHSDSV